MNQKLDNLPGKRISQKMVQLTKACYKVTMHSNDYYVFRTQATAKATKKDLGMLVLDYNQDQVTYSQGHYANLGHMKIYLDLNYGVNQPAANKYLNLPPGEIVIG